MSALPHERPDVSPAVTAALLLAAHASLRRLQLPHPSVTELLDATGAGRSRAYELEGAILALLPSLERPVGRPRVVSPAPPSMADSAALSRQVLRFVADHPGAICGGEKRRRYSDAFRRFILDLCQAEAKHDVAVIAEAVCVPLGTLKDWLQGGQQDCAVDAATTAGAKATPDATAAPVASGRIETVIEQHRAWQGTFSALCDHLRVNLRIPYGRTLIASILEHCGERRARRRPGRSPDEKALRGAFETFFPGAQWEGDGTSVDVQIGEQRFRFNLELLVDAHSAAAVGASVRDEEDGKALVEAFDDGVRTTGASPLDALVDNRSSNHTPEVDEGLGATPRTRATPGRGQSKPHVEGAFGLFAQVVPLLAITAIAPREQAQQLLEIVVQTWGRTLNHRPRRSKNGRSRVDLYTSETPTAEQIEEARAALDARRKRQEQAYQTLQARQDPYVRAILDEAFARLALVDPDGNTRSAIARYPLDAVVNGIATFEGKRNAGTLPDDVEAARYLFGIVKRISEKDEGLKIAEALLHRRLDARDRLLAPLRQTLDAVLRDALRPADTLAAMVDHALQAGRAIDRLFWLVAIVELLRDQPAPLLAPLLRHVARRIHATFAVDHHDRQDAVRFIASRAIPLS